MLVQRLVSGLILIAFMTGSMYLSQFLGGLWWVLVTFAIVAFSIREYADMLKVKNIDAPYKLMTVLALVMVLMQHFNNSLIGDFGLLVTWLTLIGWVLWHEADYMAFAFSLAGIMTIAWPLSFLASLSATPAGWVMLFFAFLIPWSTDSGAYAVGMLFGKHKMAPVISPKKSWEGAIGGTVICLVMLAIFNALFMDYPLWFILMLGLCSSVAGQVGDLLESWLKRWAGVKDSGNSIPGHGGFLDRFDSMILVAPVTYYLLVFYHTFMV